MSLDQAMERISCLRACVKAGWGCSFAAQYFVSHLKLCIPRMTFPKPPAMAQVTKTLCLRTAWGWDITQPHDVRVCWREPTPCLVPMAIFDALLCASCAPELEEWLC